MANVKCRIISNKRTFQIVLFVLIGLVALGVGYAGITAVDLIVNGHGLVTASQANFIVHFISTTTSPKITTTFPLARPRF